MDNDSPKFQIIRDAIMPESMPANDNRADLKTQASKWMFYLSVLAVISLMLYLLR